MSNHTLCPFLWLADTAIWLARRQSFVRTFISRLWSEIGDKHYTVVEKRAKKKIALCDAEIFSACRIVWQSKAKWQLFGTGQNYDRII